jgi:glycosyltransferase involved in cell wall biosynthesis
VTGTRLVDQPEENRQLLLAREHPRESITVFFPMYNEEDNIHAAVASAAEILESLTDDYEILIVDDASTDRTGEIADSLAKADPRIRVIHHPRNLRLGGALKTGFAGATKDLVLYSDADYPFDMIELVKAVRIIRQADVVSAYRFDRTGEGPIRTAYSFGWNLLIKILFGLRVKDVNFSFKLCRRKIFEQVHLSSESSFIDAELLIRSQYLGYRILQMGVDYFPRSRGISTLSSFATIRKMSGEMFRLYPELKALRREARRAGGFRQSAG